MSWETVIGLETHVQLSTKTKLFSRASTAFGASPNTNVNLIDCGLPGVLPSVNKEAFYKAIRFGMAVGAQINQTSIFDRKNYFYADLPKGYQITQMDLPIVIGGSIEIIIDELTKTINITRAHLEEDAGKSIHDEFEGFSAIDLNRAGTPLLEIVSEPEISNAKEAVAYMKAMHQLVTFLDVSDGNMAQGSLRCDANVSIRKKGDKELGTRTEIKNINSFKFIEKAINFEIKRQIKILENGEKVVQETRLYDSSKDETRPMRSKEFANDYRYFPEPDLLPVIISDEEIQKIRDEFPELPKEKEIRYQQEYGLTAYDAQIIASSKSMADFFETALQKTKNYTLLSNWLIGEISAYLNKQQIEINESKLSADKVAMLINRIDDQTISGKIGKSIFEEMCTNGSSPDEIIKSKGLEQISDDGAIEEIILTVINENPTQVEAYLAGKDKLFGFFVGQVMKLTEGKANPKAVNSILKDKLK
ncbi:MAG: Asp-tRNA(Asn)/Glu-tRNA(Gln) amidotransferase subunit GatB [SAR86 cluster bacterium]|jgi:aspartyl-tRNA(Asn)/glutamyl-tRNA(Gln) amidotransferase subunit B|nr:Asp-tRNA(Asn)/Glu-tRNA(Gln) amidotransferase subunit GatB [SAR86 cluster bacterium]MDB2339476.1 Asp-tRNA(Asn)/Glu-tRNA(Gln) amidotransferase subunit GatB [Gammaproteobacteria bacterium]MBL6701551.1 Asp-tRNA(Asn)/Glu-tRNA(Gln) amidotransferase subunit GatB [SAR86 cluster bacterium]MBL6822639.1 Asp-tRNA(Asn)/Glu-tRNA(Gln) amidotransferase subunit GatB [SAR86 cluster bacterium]MDC0332887.1 Asp-tRNA(Asn)/Glu-tRNA(Gln) amidotransferase subunit GatB [Gammaproteobacteria bacterium]